MSTKKLNLLMLTTLFIVLVSIVILFPTISLADTNTVTTTLEVKSGDDIATAFNNATKMAKDDTSGTQYVVIVPAGNYTAGYQLKVWSNTKVIMNGATIKHTTTDGSMFRLGNKIDWDEANNYKGYPGYTGYNNISFEGGILDGAGLTQAIMRFGHSQNINLKNVTFKNVKNNHMVEFGACAYVTIEKCTFQDFIGNWESGTNYEALQFDALSNGHFSSYNPDNDETPCKNVTVRGCTFKNLQRGIGTHTGVVNSYFSNIVYENNTFNNITGYAIIATNYINSTIRGNAINNCGSGIYFRTVELAHNNFYESKTHSNAHNYCINMNSWISNNTINVTTGYKTNYKNVAYGVQLAGEKLTKKIGTVPAGDFRVSGVTVSGNKITLNCTGYGVWLNGGVSNRVQNNNINCNITKKGKGGTGDGIRLQKSQSNTVSGNIINNTTKKGYDSNMSGITLCETSTSNSIISNKVSNAKKDGIHIENSKKASIVSNTIANAKRYGISLRNSGSATIKSNKIIKPKKDGIYLEKSSSMTLTSNNIQNDGRDGIASSGSSKLKFTKNTIKKSKRYGIRATKKQVKKDSKNKITKCKRARSWK